MHHLRQAPAHGNWILLLRLQTGDGARALAESAERGEGENQMTDPQTTQESVTTALVAVVIATGGTEADVTAIVDAMYPAHDEPGEGGE